MNAALNLRVSRGKTSEKSQPGNWLDREPNSGCGVRSVMVPLHHSGGHST